VNNDDNPSTVRGLNAGLKGQLVVVEEMQKE
jgi:hypothetical protein